MSLFVDESDADERVELSGVQFKRVHDKTRPIGAKEIPFEQKVAIGTLARLSGPTLASEATGVSEAAASNYSNGKISGRKNEELQKAVDQRMGIVRDIALDKLIDTLDSIDSDKLREVGPVAQSKVAQGLASVIEKTQEKSAQGNTYNVLVYTPRMSKLDDYETIVLPEAK